MEPQYPSNDVVDPAEEKRTDLPETPEEQGQVEQPDHNDLVSESAAAPGDAAPVSNDPTPETPEQPQEVNTVNQVNTVNEVTPEAPQEVPNQNPDSSESYPSSDDS